MPDTDLQDVSTQRMAGRTAEELETGMNKIQEEFGEPVSLGARTRAAFRVMRPYWRKTAWWAMLFLSIIVVMLDINAKTEGAIGSVLMWLHNTIFKQFPSFAFIGGMLACYYVIFKGNTGNRNDGMGGAA